VTQVSLQVPLSAGTFGAVLVQTEGGTSAPFTVGVTGLTAVAGSGTAADGTEGAGNPGAAITITGGGLGTAAEVVVNYLNSGNGLSQPILINPTTAAVDGTSANVILPDYLAGAFPLQIVGTAFRPQLQMVPVVDSFDITTTNGAQLRGRGFVEGAGTYQ